MVSDEATAIMLRAKILRAVEMGDVVTVDARNAPKVATVDEVLAGWVRSLKAQGLERSSVVQYAARGNWALDGFREMLRLDADYAVPGSLLTRDNVVALNLHFRSKGRGENYIRLALHALIRAWTYACDDAAVYPGLALAPRDTKSIMPRSTKYGATVAPLMSECDAVIRHIAPTRQAKASLALAILARCTGLRTAQIMAIRPDDIDLGAATLVVTVGKSAREKAERRTVPLAPALMDFLVPLLNSAREERRLYLIHRRSDSLVFIGEQKIGGSGRITLRRAWEACTVAGETRREVWAPANREKTRPDHAFRSAFLGALKRANIEKEVRNALVGHQGDMADRHYAGAETLMDAMRRAVALIPPIDWKGAKAEKPSNVVSIHRSK